MTIISSVKSLQQKTHRIIYFLNVQLRWGTPNKREKDSLGWYGVDTLVPEYGTKAYREAETRLHPFSASAPDGCKWPAWRLGRFTPGEQPIVSIVQEAGWDQSRSGRFGEEVHLMFIAMATGIPYRVCQPKYLIVYAHRYTLSSMPTRIPYRVCPSIYLIVYVHWYPLNAKNPRFSAAIYECQRGEESGRSLSDCLGRCLHRSDARTTAPASRRCSVSSHFREEYSVTLHVTKNS